MGGAEGCALAFYGMFLTGIEGKLFWWRGTAIGDGASRVTREVVRSLSQPSIANSTTLTLGLVLDNSSCTCSAELWTNVCDSVGEGKLEQQRNG